MKKLLKITTLVILVVLIYFAYNFYRLYSLAPNGAKAYSTYSFPNSKYYLENKIDSLIQFDKKIFRNQLDNSPTAKFYNTGRYFTVNIDSVDFIFRYRGDSLDWVNSKDSIKIFLTSINSFKKRKLSNEEKLQIVEEQFINKLRE
jgi:hypothetical protein